MNRAMNLLVLLLGLTLLGVAPVWAQQPSGAADPHHPPAAAPTPAPGGTQGPPGSGAMPMMEMCRQMMAGPMMGMSADQKTDPRMMAQMLQMRGEMMKAMGEVMMKHGTMLQGPAKK